MSSQRLNEYLSLPLRWEPVFSPTESYRCVYNDTTLSLLVNSEFPENGPFYRLQAEGEILEFDDAPESWVFEKDAK